MLNVENKKGYISPEIEIIEFEFEESIASSGNQDSGAALFDEIWD